MQFALASSLLALSPLVAMASPTPNTFEVAITKHQMSVDDQIIHYQGLKQKYLRHAQTIRKRALQKRQANSSSSSGDLVSLNLDEIQGTPQQPVWTANVAIGTPGQAVTLQVDTGSADLWIATPQATAQGVTETYDPTKSSSAVAQNMNFVITYGDTTGAFGPIYEDTVNINNKLTIPKQLLGAASSTNATSPGLDGLMGMGFDTLSTISHSTNGGATVLTNLGNGVIPSDIFSMQLIQDSSNPGSILFGGTDSTQYQGQLVYSPVTQDSSTGGYTFWQVALDAIVVNGNSQSVGNNVPVVIDSGTVLVMLTNDLAEPILTAIGAQYSSNVGGYVMSCNPTGELVEFTIGGTNFGIPVGDLPLGKLSGNTCFAGIQPGGAAGSGVPNILGDIWMQSKYIVFDNSQKRIGFANRAGVSLNASSGSGGSKSSGAAKSFSGASTVAALAVVALGAMFL